jgi:prepilin-type N-terminal cleavage/methylation domain-containing protein
MRAGGFNLIEIILVTGIIAILATLSLAIYTRILATSGLDEFADQAKQDLRLASSYSRAGYLDSDYGVYFDRSGSGETLVFYKGDTYETRDTFYDRAETFSGRFISSTTLEIGSGLSFDVNFNKYSGIPENTGEIVIEKNDARKRILGIDSLGTVNE